MRVPKLRFKEFSGEWEERRLDNVTELIKDGTHGTHEDVENGIALLSAKDIKNGIVNIPEDCRKISINDFYKIHKNYQLENDDLLLTIVGTIGEVGIVENYNNNYTFQRSVGIIRPKKEKLNPKFCFQYFNTSIFQNFLKNKANSSAQAGVYLGELSKIDIKFPTLEEQEKIGRFLSAVDKKIELTFSLLDEFKTYKKGIMQKIFTQKLRFKDVNGEPFPDWQEKRLGDIAQFSKGKLISKEDITENGLECIRYGELYTHYNEVINKIISKTNLNISDLVLSEKNDIIIPSSGETAIDIAKASCVMKSGVALGGDLNIIKLKENGVFLSYYLNNRARNQIASLAQGASVVHLYEEHLKKLKIQLPSLAEQQKIADFLSSIDSKIDLLDKELEGLRAFKKSLLQQMFI